MLDENMLIKASKAARGITAAQAAVDEAKRLVEEAKAGVETAKNGLVEAKSAYDAVISEIAGTGLSATKARKAVEDMLRIFAEVGIIDTAGAEASAEPKPQRRKKADAPAAPAETAAVAEPNTSQGEAADVAEPDVATETEVVVDEAAVEEVAPPVEAALAVVEVPEAEVSDVAEIDNGEVIGEIYALIESSTENEDIAVSETLIALLNAADWYSREHRNEALTLDLYREILNIDFVNQAAASDGIDKEMKASLETAAKLDAAESIFEWFLHVLEKLESNGRHLSFAEFLAQNAAPADEQAAEVSTVVEEVVEVASTAVEVAVDAEEVEVENTDYTPDPESDEDNAEEVSDDVTLAAADGLVGVEVEDIEGINFLEQPEAPAAAAVEEPSAPAAEVEGAAPRGFKRPSFLTKKS
jgi:hypothetical protein